MPKANVNFKVAASHAFDFGKGCPDPHHKLPTMRPPREIWGPLTDKPNAVRISNPSAAPKATHAGKVPQGKGGNASFGRATSILSRILGMGSKRSPAYNDSDEGDEGESEDLMGLWIQLSAPRPPSLISFGSNGALGGKKTEPS